MTGTRAQVLAVGGRRQVPEPDPFARDYLLLALRLDRLVPGLVDGYFGPADLRAQVDAEGPHPAPALADAAAALRGRLSAEVAEADRHRWLDAQLIALEAQARAAAGDGLPYLEHVTACFDYQPGRTPEAVFDAAAAELDALLPGDGPLPAGSPPGTPASPSRSSGSGAWWTPSCRASGAGPRRSSACPTARTSPSRSCATSRGAATTGTTAGARSRVELNTDLPIRAADLLSVLPHETYPGHHLEHAWHEAHLVDGLGRMEASVLCINAPECLLSEGLADLGRRFAVPPDDEAELLVEVYRLAGSAGPRRRRRRAGSGRAPGRDHPGARRGARRGRQRGAHAPRGRRAARRGARVPGAAPPRDARAGRQAPRVHHPPALAHVRLRLLRGRAAPAALARDGAAGPASPRASAGSWSSS